MPLEQMCPYNTIQCTSAISADAPVGSKTFGIIVLRAVQHSNADESEYFAEAALHAAELVRLSQARAYQERGRSMVASDILHHLQQAVAEAWPLKAS